MLDIETWKKKKKIGTRTYIERRSNMMIVDNLLEWTYIPASVEHVGCKRYKISSSYQTTKRNTLFPKKYNKTWKPDINSIIHQRIG